MKSQFCASCPHHAACKLDREIKGKIELFTTLGMVAVAVGDDVLADKAAGAVAELIVMAEINNALLDIEIAIAMQDENAMRRAA